MALSEREQQVLDEIEQDLSTHSPVVLSSLHRARRYLRASARPAHALGLPSGLSLLLAGLTVLLLGVHADNTVGIVVGVVGYLVTVLATRVTLAALGRWRHRRRSRAW
jgi:hypothetical protein